MASLSAQTNVNETDYFYLTRVNTQFISPATFTNQTQNTSETITVASVASGFSFKDATGNVVNRFIQDELTTEFFIAGNPQLSVYKDVFAVGHSLKLYDSSGNYMTLSPPSPARNGIIQTANGTGFTFTATGLIQLNSNLQVGTSYNGDMTVGPLSDQVDMTPEFFSFLAAGTRVGGLYRESQTINIYSGNDPYFTSLGLRVSPNTIAFGKNVDAVSRVSMTAQGNIITQNTAADAGGQLQAENGNYTLTMVARGDGHSPTGTGGVITASSPSSIVSLTLNTGLNSNIVGPTSGVLTVTASNTINLNAPNVFTNNGPVTNLVWYYQTTATSSVAGNASVLWTGNTYIQPGLPNPMDPTGAAWSAPFPGLYFVTVSLYIGTGGNQLLLVYSINSFPYLIPAGTPMYTVNAFTVSMSCYVQLTAGQALGVIAPTGSTIIIQPNAGFSIQYISP